jgi:hypothetical protein
MSGIATYHLNRHSLTSRWCQDHDRALGFRSNGNRAELNRQIHCGPKQARVRAVRRGSQDAARSLDLGRLSEEASRPSRLQETEGQRCLLEPVMTYYPPRFPSQLNQKDTPRPSSPIAGRSLAVQDPPKGEQQFRQIMVGAGKAAGASFTGKYHQQARAVESAQMALRVRRAKPLVLPAFLARYPTTRSNVTLR